MISPFNRYGSIEKSNPFVAQEVLDEFALRDPNYQGAECLMSLNDRFCLYFTVRFLLPDPPILFVDLGTYGGGSVLSIYNALTSSGKDFRGYTVDSYSQEEHKNPRETFLGMILPRIGDRVEFLEETTASAAKRIPNDVSFLLIDAGHDLVSVYSDIEEYLPLMRKGGVILLHDYVPLDYQSFARYDPAHDCYWIGAEPVLFGTSKACSMLLDPYYKPLDIPLLSTSWKRPIGYNIPGVPSLIRGYRV